MQIGNVRFPSVIKVQQPTRIKEQVFRRGMFGSGSFSKLNLFGDYSIQ